jgi:hypothetical protein
VADVGFQLGLNSASVIGTITGVIAQFIGATFLFLYRSSNQQATAYMTILERINSVGMGIVILDQIAVDAKELKDRTRADMIKLLLAWAGAVPK